MGLPVFKDSNLAKSPALSKIPWDIFKRKFLRSSKENFGHGPTSKAIRALFIASSAPSIVYFGIAIIAGFAAAFSLVKPQLNENLPGVAISVALIPPLAVIGIGVAQIDWVIINNALFLFLVNTLGIVFTGMVTFSLMNFYIKRKVAQQTVQQEDKRIEKEIKKVEQKNGKNDKKTITTKKIK